MSQVPVRLKMRRAAGWRLQSVSQRINGLPAVCVGRPSKWGNPWRVGGPDWDDEHIQSVIADSGRAVARYQAWCADVLRGPGAISMRAELGALAGRNLACWCALCARHADSGKPFDEDCADCAPCHADVLGRLAAIAPSQAGAIG